MSKENSHLRSVIETVGVVVGSFIFAMVVIVAATKSQAPEALQQRLLRIQWLRRKLLRQMLHL